MKDDITTRPINRSLNDIQAYYFEKIAEGLAEQFHDVPREATNKIATDLTLPVSSAIRSAIVGRYPLCLALCEDYERCRETHPGRINSLEVLNEPCVVAAAIALRPYQFWEWHLVEAWSWVYRHAVKMNVSINGFERWCEFRDPNISHDFLTSQFPELYNRSFYVS